MKKLIFTLLIITSLFSAEIKIGDTILETSYKDQYDTTYTIDKNVKTLIIAFTRDGGNIVKEALTTKGGEYQKNNNILYIADISGMPSVISNFFAIPKMKKYNFSVLLEREKDLKTIYPYSRDKTTIIKMNANKVEEIIYISNQEELLKNI